MSGMEVDKAACLGVTLPLVTCGKRSLTPCLVMVGVVLVLVVVVVVVVVGTLCAPSVWYGG